MVLYEERVAKIVNNITHWFELNILMECTFCQPEKHYQNGASNISHLVE